MYIKKKDILKLIARKNDSIETNKKNRRLNIYNIHVLSWIRSIFERIFINILSCLHGSRTDLYISFK